MTPQLPKQTIERIEREAIDHVLASYRASYRLGATREALLVLPVLEAAKVLNQWLGSMRAMGELISFDIDEAHLNLESALTNYEQGTVK